MGGYLVVGVVAYLLIVGGRAAVAALARVPGRLPPFGEAPRAELAGRSFSLRLALTLAGAPALLLLLLLPAAVAGPPPPPLDPPDQRCPRRPHPPARPAPN